MIKGSDFTKVGAFVQEEDVLQGGMTCREHLTFAARMRSDPNTDEVMIRMNVDKLLKRMDLVDCQNTKFGRGGKGLSGGEKKRTSIAYELVGDPAVLLLDEPTSGLDSETALNLCRLLKREARGGLSILATIHSPSADIFHTFDRVIVLADGYTIYNGATKDVVKWLNGFGYAQGQYVNPADTLLKVAHWPSSIHSELDVLSLALAAKLGYKQPGHGYDDYAARTFCRDIRGRGHQ